MNTSIPPLDSVENLIWHEAHRCVVKMGPQSIWDQEDLFQEGCFQYGEAVKKYNPNKGAKFTTYFTTWLRCTFASILDGVARHRVVNGIVDEIDVEEKEHISEIGWENITFVGEVSERCMQFLSCLFSPPPEVMDIVRRRKETLKTWNNDMRRPICEFLKMSEDEYQRMVKELRSNAVLTF